MVKNAGTKKENVKGYMKIPVPQLREIVYRLFLASGLPEEESGIAADCIMETEMCGVDTHGISMLPAHLQKIKSGGYNSRPVISVIKETGAFAVIDADNSIGSVSAVRCMGHAMKKSSGNGIFTVFCQNGNTYGAAFLYALQASREGLIGITFSNSPAAMPAWGGREKLFGTNPFAIAVPCREREPVIFDMSTSVAAKSKIKQAADAGADIPSGWAIDERGVPTTDSVAALRGLVLPSGGHKGYGLAMTIDILAGVLGGAGFLDGVGKFYREEDEDGRSMNVGQVFVAIDPSVVCGKDFYELMDIYTERIRKTPGAEGAEVRIPGENKMKKRTGCLEEGIEINAATAEKINGCLASAGLEGLSIGTAAPNS